MRTKLLTNTINYAINITEYSRVPNQGLRKGSDKMSTRNIEMNGFGAVAATALVAGATVALAAATLLPVVVEVGQCFTDIVACSMKQAMVAR